MKEYEDYNNKFFSRWAPIYDGLEIVLSNVREKISQEINPINKSVLDVATGTGSLAIALSPKATRVVGIDLSAKMLNIARKKKRNKNLSFLQMDASAMEFQENEFDIVTISLGLHDMPLEIRTAVLEEVKKVLKKDGELYILEYDLPRNKLLGLVSSRLINLYESRYYLEFSKSNLINYLSTFGFRLRSKTNFLSRHLQFLTLTNPASE